MSRANLLSQYSLIGLFREYPKSCRRNFSHNPSQIQSAIPLSSASPLEQATIFCFLLLHVTRLLRYPEVDRISLLSLAQSASVYTSMACSTLLLENKIPFLGANFRYLKMRITAFMCCLPGLYMN